VALTESYSFVDSLFFSTATLTPNSAYPYSGLYSGGYFVTITGTNLQTDQTCVFGSTSAAVEEVSSTHMVCVAPNFGGVAGTIAISSSSTLFGVATATSVLFRVAGGKFIETLCLMVILTLCVEGVILGFNPMTLAGRYNDRLTIVGSDLFSASDITSVTVCDTPATMVSQAVLTGQDKIVVSIALDVSVDTCIVVTKSRSHGQASASISIELRT